MAKNFQDKPWNKVRARRGNKKFESIVNSSLEKGDIF